MNPLLTFHHITLQLVTQDILHLIFRMPCFYTGFWGVLFMEYGIIRIKLEKQLKESGLSKNKFCQRAELQRTQLNRYLNNDVALLDRSVLGRMCSVLDCDISDILEYVPARRR